MTPFEAVYGQAPANHIPYLAGDSKMEVVDRSLRVREACINMLNHLERAQRSDRVFEVGDLVFVKLQPYRQQLVAVRTSEVSSQNFWPFSHHSYWCCSL